MAYKSFRISGEAFLIVSYLQAKGKIEQMDYSWESIFSRGFKLAEKMKHESFKVIVPTDQNVKRFKISAEIKNAQFDKLTFYANKLGYEVSDLIELFLWSFVIVNFEKNESDFFKLYDWGYSMKEWEYCIEV